MLPSIATTSLDLCHRQYVILGRLNLRILRRIAWAHLPKFSVPFPHVAQHASIEMIVSEMFAPEIWKAIDVFDVILSECEL